MRTLKTFIHKISGEKIGILLLFLLWVSTQIGAYFHFGVMTPVDTELYIDNAKLITLGEWPHSRDFLYSAYSSLIAILYLLGLEATWMVFIQILVSGAALISIYKITQIISKNNLTPFIAGLLYIFWFKFQQWNLILYTDSLFANLVVVAVFFLLSAKSKLSYLVAFIIIAFTTLLRPTGIGFLIAILSYILYDKVNSKQYGRRSKIVILTLFFGLSLIILNEVLRDFVASFLQSYATAEIIYPQISLGIDKPQQLYMPNDQHQPLFQLMLFMVRNPYYMFKISFIKAILFLGHIKPYYSFFHNVFIGCFLYPIYFFALRGAKFIPKNTLYVFILVFIGFQVITISLTSENWDGRFLLPLLPWVFILSSIGISEFFQKRFNGRTLWNKG
jgi:hypothetical protein